MIRKALILLSATAAIGAAAGLAATRGSSADVSPPDAPPKGNFSIAQAQEFADFPLYDAGSSVDGIPLTNVFHSTGSASTFVSFLYGDCHASDDMGCAPSLEIQVWPACIRNPSLYKSSRPGALTPGTTSVRGVPAATFEGGSRLEITTGTSTVVVFARTPAVAMQVAGALRGVNLPVQASDPLPQPAAGALDGKLRCG
jgi:hypothetical protein